LDSTIAQLDRARQARPKGVTALGVLATLIGLLGIGGGAVLISNTDVTLAALSAFALIIGFLYLIAGVGFFRGNERAWALGMIVSVLALIRNSAEVATGEVAFGAPGVTVATIVIYYLTRPAAKAFFGRVPMGANSSPSH